MVDIVSARTDDLPEVADLWVDLAVEQRRHDSRMLAEANRDVVLGVLSAHQLEDGLLVARTDERIVGFVTVAVESGSFSIDVTRGRVSNLYVIPAARNCGVGTALLAAAESTLAERGVDVVILEVMARNNDARRFYERRGYHTHRVTMEKSIGRGDSNDEDGGENDTHTRE